MREVIPTKTLHHRKEEGINLYAILSNYLVYWLWFLISIGLCLAGTYVYWRYQTPVYNIRSAVLIKEQDNTQKTGNNALTAVTDLGFMSMTNNFDNELQILKSQTMVKKVVSDLELYITHHEERSFGYSLPLYQNIPVKVYMNPEEANLLENGVTVRMEYRPNVPLEVEVEYTHQGEKKTVRQRFPNLPAAIPAEIGVITLTPGTGDIMNRPASLTAHITTPDECASTYCSNMTVEPVSKTTTIAQINVKNTIKKRGIDFILQLVKIYNSEANEEKNEVAQKTAEFIEERIAIINKELGNTEETLAHFKQRSRLTDLTSDAQMALQETSKYEQQLTENATQISLIQDLANYIQNPENAEEVIPANVGIQDPNLANVINQYNTMIAERKRLLHTSSASNPAVINLTMGLNAMRSTVQTTVSSVLRGLRITEKNLLREAQKHEGRISNAPTQEKEYMNIARQQEIKASLYTMLLQKREENAITLASTASNGRIIENPLAGKVPVSPPTRMYFLTALLVGVVLPVVFLFINDQLSYKIENRKDIERMTDVPILAEIPKADLSQAIKGSIVIHENQNNLMEEVFRSFRTNLLFMLEPNEKVIMITSSQPSEGKSFVAGNLAVSLAYLGKRVVIVGLDIRQTGMDKVFELDGKLLGISDYLSHPEETNLKDLILPSGLSPKLDILPRGSIPPNPTELVARNTLDKAIEQLKEEYELIVLDTAPIGMVTDTTLISRVADLCVYVCRADYTSKEVFSYINELEENTDMKLATMLNSINLGKRKNQLKYGYKYRYGYGYKQENRLH